MADSNSTSTTTTTPGGDVDHHLRVLMRDERVRVHLTSWRAMEIVAKEERIPVNELNQRFANKNLAVVLRNHEDERLFHLIRVKYEELAEAGYPHIALDENPDHYLCIYGSYADEESARSANGDGEGSGGAGGNV
ncbi:hypothetical protein MD484_g5626, partial [Candolleomyces efflorescens]